MSLYTLWAIIKEMRPKQWVKNAVIYAPLVFDRQLSDPSAILRTTAGFFIFCLLSGMVYTINDISDVEVDKIHPKKRKRPIAAGDLPVPIAVGMVIVMGLIVFPLSYLLSPFFFLISLIYFLLNLAYSEYGNASFGSFMNLSS